MWHTSLSLWDSLYSWGDKASPQENESILGSYELREVFKALDREPCDCFCWEISLRIDWAGRLLLGAGGDCFSPWKKPGNSTGRLGKRRQHVQVKGIIITFPLPTWWSAWEGVSLAHHPILTHLLGCTQANPDLWKSHDASSLGNLFGLVILWQYSVVTSSGFSAPLCSMDWFSWEWAPPFRFADSVIDCLLHRQDVEPTLLLKPVRRTFPWLWLSTISPGWEDPSLASRDRQGQPSAKTYPSKSHFQ